MDSIAHIDKVANIPELMEEILFQLPFLDLVLATGVNYTWRNIIYSSAKLQRKLFRLPSKELFGKRFVDKHGVVGRRMNQKQCLDNDNEGWTATLCPFLLAPGYGYNYRSAFLTERAARATFWPYMYLTNPPCAHAHVDFTYKGVSKYGTLIIVEGGRSLYRRDGVTIVAIEEALYQSGAVKVKAIAKNSQHTPQTAWGTCIQKTTMWAQIAFCEKVYKCKLAIDFAETQIRLHCNPVAPEGTIRLAVPYRFKHMSTAVPVRKIKFED